MGLARPSFYFTRDVRDLFVWRWTDAVQHVRFFWQINFQYKLSQYRNVLFFLYNVLLNGIGKTCQGHSLERIPANIFVLMYLPLVTFQCLSMYAQNGAVSKRQTVQSGLNRHTHRRNQFYTLDHWQVQGNNEKYKAPVQFLITLSYSPPFLSVQHNDQSPGQVLCDGYQSDDHIYSCHHSVRQEGVSSSHMSVRTLSW